MLGALSLGYVLIFAVYLMAWTIAVVYVRVVNRRFDPMADEAVRRHRHPSSGRRRMKTLTPLIFLVILGTTVGITYWAAKRTRTTSEFYTAGGALGPAQNGLALAGAG